MGPAILLAGLLAAQPAAAPPPRLVPGRELQWTGRSTDLWRFFPSKAAKYGIDSGLVSLICEVADERRIGRCDVLENNPDDFQFGEAAQMFLRQVTLLPRHAPRTGEPVLIEMRMTYPEKDSMFRVFRAVPEQTRR